MTLNNQLIKHLREERRYLLDQLSEVVLQLFDLTPVEQVDPLTVGTDTAIQMYIKPPTDASVSEKL